MRIEKRFDIAVPREAVWTAFNDIQLVASCLPGASVTEDLGNGAYKGKFSIKLGPMAAAFAGDISIERKPDDWTAVVAGKGADQRSSSRANGSMTYRLSGGQNGQTTSVDVTSEINLAGALAQFGKAGVIQEVASRLTNEFVRNFEAKITPSMESHAPSETVNAIGAGAHPTESNPPALDAGTLIWSILKDRLHTLFRRLVGKSA